MTTWGPQVVDQKAEFLGTWLVSNEPWKQDKERNRDELKAKLDYANPSILKMRKILMKFD